MDDLPLPFQTDPHHLGLLNQDSPMLSPNPPPSVIVDSQNLLQHNLTSTATTNLLNSSIANQNNQNNIISNNLNSTTSTNVIINNIKTNTTTIGTTNPDSGIVHQLSTGSCDDTGADVDTTTLKLSRKSSKHKKHWRTCPELHKAMDGVTYIADHTKREEESTRVSIPLFCIISLNFNLTKTTYIKINR
jgi:nicotinic acetylcholine receptor